MDKKLIRLLKKKARGYRVSEVSEEFGLVDGEQVLLKRKVSKKHVPPDLSAIKLLLEFDLSATESLTPEQMEEEKARLISLLSQSASNQ